MILKNPEKLKIGVIGTGHMGVNHVRNLAEEKRFDLVGVYDVDGKTAEEIAARYDTVAFGSMELLFEAVDAVVIAAPSSLHMEIALLAAEYGVHALVEKPLATTSGEAQRIVEVFREKELVLAVGHVERFNPVFRELQKLVQGADIYYIEACRYSPFSISGRITDVSVIEDLMIHDVDLVCALMNGKKASGVHGRGRRVLSGQTDFATCLLDFNTAAHAVIHASRVSQNKERKITVHTADSCIHADLLAKTLEIYRSTNLTVDLADMNSYTQDGIIQKVFVPTAEPLRGELLAFYDAVVLGVPAAVDGQMAMNAIRICEQVAEDAEKHNTEAMV